MYRRILIPTDGSACARNALEQGVELARTLGAEVCFIHALESPFAAGYVAPEALPYSGQLYAEMRAAAEKLLAEAKELADARGVRADTQLVESRDPVEAIHQAEDDADLVVMGTHGRRGMRRWMFGSVAEGALRRSRKPYLLVHSDQD